MTNSGRFLSSLIVPLVGIAVVIAGCGYDASDPVYDIETNPRNFPAKAVALLEGIETGDLATYEQITDAFAHLYSSEPSLLGDKDWSEVTERLGQRLVYRADQLVRDGVLQFERAADYYTVALQIQDTDPELVRKARLFTAWHETLGDSLIDLACLTDDTADSATFDCRLRQLIHFALIDSTHYLFADGYLAPALFEEVPVEKLLSRKSAPRLTVPDMSLLAALDVVDMIPDTAVGRFDEPDVVVNALRISALGDDRYRAEIYFLPREPIALNYNIAFWVETPDTMLTPDNQPAFPYDFTPPHPTSSWPPGELQLAVQAFTFHWPISAVSIGLYHEQNGRIHSARPVGTDAARIRIPLSDNQIGNYPETTVLVR